MLRTFTSNYICQSQEFYDNFVMLTDITKIMSTSWSTMSLVSSAKTLKSAALARQFSNPFLKTALKHLCMLLLLQVLKVAQLFPQSSPIEPIFYKWWRSILGAFSYGTPSYSLTVNVSFHQYSFNINLLLYRLFVTFWILVCFKDSGWMLSQLHMFSAPCFARFSIFGTYST